jgi:ABC-type sugar transport system permease subunit
MLRESRAETLTAYAFVFPAVFFYTLFLAIPTLGTVAISFFDWSGITFADMQFVGLGNYAELASDGVFFDALLHNLIFIAVGTTATVVLGLGLAVLLEQELPGSRMFRGIFFVPSVTSLVVVGIVFTLLLSPELGVVNPLLEALGLGGLTRAWLGDPGTALPAVIAADVWRSFGLAMFIFVAGLKGIDVGLHEAARVDGATAWQQFRHITLPLLRPVTLTVVLLVSIQSLKLFDLVYVMTNGGPSHASEVLSTWTYYQAFTFNRMGYASSISVTLLLITVGIGILQVRANRER